MTDPEIRFTSRPINIREFAILSRFREHPTQEYLVVQFMLSRLETSRVIFLAEPAERITAHVAQCSAMLNYGSMEDMFNSVSNKKKVM